MYGIVAVTSAIPKPTGTKGVFSRNLEQRIQDVAGHYRKLTVRQFYYIMISRFRFPPGKRFYKRFEYHLNKIRYINPWLNNKIVDRTREFIPPPSPYAFHEIELWVEKDAIRMQIEDLAVKYRISIQVLRGYGSLTVYRNALKRAKKSGVKKILYVGDFDPSGVHIEEVVGKEMRDIEIERIAITPEQAKRYRLPPLKVNRKDSRAKKFIKIYGNRTWELEALRPRTFLKILEDALNNNIPQEFLIKAKEKDKAAKIAKPITNKISKSIQREILSLLKKGISEKEIRKLIASRFSQKIR